MKTTEQKLEILYDLLVDNLDVLETEIAELICNPSKIKNTNKFASLLSNLKNSDFINPLLLTISLSEKGDSWLCDFLYAATNLFDESSVNDTFKPPKNLINKLQVWILDNKGELSWHAASLLKFYESKNAERIQLQKLEERGDFFLTYVECIGGLMRYDENKHIELVKQISLDETRDKDLREFASELTKKFDSTY